MDNQLYKKYDLLDWEINHIEARNKEILASKVRRGASIMARLF